VTKQTSSWKVNELMNPFLIAATTKSFAQAGEDLLTAVKALGFGVLAVHDLGDTLRSKGIPFSEECKIFEVCNPTQAAKVLSSNMALSMALPCRISVYTESGQTLVGMIRPEPMLSTLSSDPELQAVAAEVENTITAIIEKAVHRI
jgi:uncharacterized protein (DUF302 family)